MAVCQTALKGDHLVVLTSQSISTGTVKWFLHSYNLDTASESRSFELKSRPTCCSFSENGKRLAIGFLTGAVQVRWFFIKILSNIPYPTSITGRECYNGVVHKEKQSYLDLEIPILLTSNKEEVKFARETGNEFYKQIEWLLWSPLFGIDSKTLF